jgi:uncharacterized membrane protein YfcA
MNCLRRTPLLPWFIWLGLFYGTWVTLVAGGRLWLQMAVHWPIALAMAVGSYVAGSTPMGGGTVGFPILVLLFKYPATLGRDFSLCIQSIGMVSASIFILSSQRKIAWPMLRWSMAASTVAFPLSTLFLVPHISDLSIKLLFAVIWCSFGIMTLVKIREMCELTGMRQVDLNYERVAGILVGIIGGVVASITGVGIDMIIYAVLVLLWRMDLKIAVPTSVILMAYVSVIGVATHVLYGGLDPQVFYNWLAAAPVVCLGAPLGAFIVSLIDRKPTLIFVALLCIGQFAWTSAEEHLGIGTMILALGGVTLFQFFFHLLYTSGKKIPSLESAEPSGVVIAALSPAAEE